MLRGLFGMRSAQKEFERGTAAARAGRMAEGIIALRRAIELRPDFPEALYNLGAAYRDAGNSDAALAAYRRAAEVVPKFADVYVDIASILRERRELDEAERNLRTALALKPDFPEALLELGNVHKNAGDWRAAVEAFARAARIAPNYGRARWAAVLSQIPLIDDLDTDRAERRQAFARELESLEAWAAGEPESFRVVGDHQPFYLAYHEAWNRDLLARYGRLCASLMQRWQNAAKLAPPARRKPGAPERGRDSKIRVGIVSAHFSDHSVWLAFVRGWVQRLDRRRFELHLFHLSAKRDAETELAISIADGFHDGKGHWENWARFIFDSRMDVLIYPEIGMDPTTAKLAALRLAPVQATSWGQPQTSGLPTMDYYLSAEALEPAGAQAHYTEKLQLLPGTSCWLERGADEGGEADRARLGLASGEVSLICPGTPFKYAAEHDALLVAIARGVPSGRLVFFRGPPEALARRWERRLRSAFEREGLPYERHVLFVPWQEPHVFRSLLAAADLYLDTVGFSGFNTALQAVRAGLPVVTREGRFMRGRLASGMLRHIGLDELVATSDAAYVDLAVALANDAPRRQRLRQRLRAARDRLFEDDAPIRALEAFLEQAAGAR
jgi:predicted O-linked N-acetylglucosamine transferase (SPINDLY family)